MDRALAVGVVLVFLAAFFSAYFIARIVPEAPSILEFEEHDELVLRVDSEGDACGEVSFYLPPSPFTDVFKQVVLLTRIESYAQSIEEELRNSFALRGLEVDNIWAVVKFNAGMRIDATLRVHRVARWTGEGWRIDFGWINPEDAAEEELGEQKIERLLYRSFARDSGYEDANFWQFYTTSIQLPADASGVVLLSSTDSEYVDYGGGSYLQSSLSLEQENEVWVLSENGVRFVTTQNEFTIEPSALADNVVSLALTFSAPMPENWSFVESVEQVRLDLKFGRELREKYPVVENGSIYWLTPAQILYNAARYLLAENAALESKAVASPENESGEWGAVWRWLSREEYRELAEQVVLKVDETGRAPSTVDTPVGHMRFRDVLYLFLRVVHEVAENGAQPENVLVAPVPSGQLEWGAVKVPASYAYFLLPDSYVITGTELVENVLASLPDNLDRRALAEEIADWTSSALSYSPSYSPLTSEKVLSSRRGQCRDYTNAYLALARTAGLPSRRVIGWVYSSWVPPAGWGHSSTTTSEGKTVALHAWVEVYVPDEGWIPLDPQYSGAHVGELPNAPYREFRQSWVNALAAYEVARGLL